MIKDIHIQGFKAHRDTKLCLGNLTLLTGLNSSGKTSVLQSLLLLRQSYGKQRLSQGLDLNAPLCDIGKGADALHKANPDDMIRFALGLEKNCLLDYRFSAKSETDTFLPYLDGHQMPNMTPEKISLFNADFQYISSSRIANVGQYPIDTFAVERERRLSLEYGQGELVGHFLQYYGSDFEVEIETIRHPREKRTQLINQVIAWEQEISPRISLTPQKKDDHVVIKYSYSYDSEYGKKSALSRLGDLSAKNIGYGISYSLAVVVALLSARPGALLLIENPEAHLHPRGQSKLANLIARVAHSGVQVIVETHSDHIFNGIIRSTIAGDIHKEETSVYYFDLNGENVSCATKIEYSNRGIIQNPQKGFFDQFDEDLNVMLGL